MGCASMQAMYAAWFERGGSVQREVMLDSNEFPCACPITSSHFPAPVDVVVSFDGVNKNESNIYYTG